MNRVLLVAAALTVLAVSSASAQSGDRWFYGGGLGVSFGDVDYVEVSPLIGYRASDRLSTGLGALYRHRKDDRFGESLTTNDFGGNLFARYSLSRQAFLHGEYEYLDYEFIDLGNGTTRDTFSSVLAGGGYRRPTVGRASLFVLALYNFSYDDDDRRSPYTEPWTIRVGATVGF